MRHSVAGTFVARQVSNRVNNECEHAPEGIAVWSPSPFEVAIGSDRDDHRCLRRAPEPDERVDDINARMTPS
jgi:hypothetical protein